MLTTEVSVPVDMGNAFFALMKVKFNEEGFRVIGSNPTDTGFLSGMTIYKDEDQNVGYYPRAVAIIATHLINHSIYKNLNNGEKWFYEFDCDGIDREGWCEIQKVSATEMKLDIHTCDIGEFDSECDSEDEEDPCDIQHPTSPQAGCPMELVE
jgi:hypothetical protein